MLTSTFILDRKRDSGLYYDWVSRYRPALLVDMKPRTCDSERRTTLIEGLLTGAAMMVAVANPEPAAEPVVAPQHQAAAAGTWKFAVIQPDCWRVGYGMQMDPVNSGTVES
ncbi:hypothetical protein [Kutzneria sp. NPDC052558]|uniref:hypothetical protein n=1 Tax=Kutzneria sp. NPDC052558 TaxID=3364121 RepID=UPI0037CA2487